MNNAASNPARAWPTSWGKEATKWCADKLFYAKIREEVYPDKQSFVRHCLSETKGMINPQVPSDVWDEHQAKQKPTLN